MRSQRVKAGDQQGPVPTSAPAHLPGVAAWVSPRAMGFLAFTHTAGVLRLTPAAVRGWARFGVLERRGRVYCVAEEADRPHGRRMPPTRKES
jgi:hypothetical protein